MKRALAATITTLALLAGATTAEASITTNYCWSSLNGGGSLAPDNDVAAAKTHYGATGAYANYFGSSDGGRTDIIVQVVLYGGRVGSNTRVYQWMGCWNNTPGTSSGYHDTPAWGGWTY